MTADERFILHTEKAIIIQCFFRVFKAKRIAGIMLEGRAAHLENVREVNSRDSRKSNGGTDWLKKRSDTRLIDEFIQNHTKILKSCTRAWKVSNVLHRMAYPGN